MSLGACGEEPPSQFSKPSLTFKHHQQALAAKDLETMWSCYSQSYKQRMFSNDFAAWSRTWQERDAVWIEAELAREIIDEREINERIAYLHFEPTTLQSRQASPFYYFLKEVDGWKITTHLDSLFHQELERAIADGQFSLPDN